MIAQSNLPQSSNVSAVAVTGATQTNLPSQADTRVTVRAATRKDRGAIRKIECACFGRSRFLLSLWPRTGACNVRSWIMLMNDSSRRIT